MGWAGEGSVWLVVGGLLIGTSWLLRRGHARRIASLRSDPLREARDWAKSCETSPQSMITQAEVRLHDLARESEARIANRMAVLQELVSQADDVCDRIERLLAESDLRHPEDRAAA
jgi:hypothetical protein